MSTEIEKRGYRPFFAGSVALVVVGFLVLTGLLIKASSSVAEPIRTLMEQFDFDEPFGQPTMWQIHRSMSFAAGILLIGLGCINLLLPSRDDSAVLRRLIVLNTVIVGVLAVSYLLNAVSPIYMPLAIAEICFLVAFYRSSPRAASSG